MDYLLRTSDGYETQAWVVWLFAILILILLFIGMFVLSFYKKKKEKEIIKTKDMGNKFIEKNTKVTRHEVIKFIEELYNENKDYDKSNLNTNVANLKKDVKRAIEEKMSTNEYEEYELVYGRDDLIKLMLKLHKEPITVWHKFFEEELGKVKNDNQE